MFFFIKLYTFDIASVAFFSSALMSLGLLLDGILYLLPDYDTPCYQYKVVYGLFIVPIVTGFFSVLGMSIERFQVSTGFLAF